MTFVSFEHNPGGNILSKTAYVFTTGSTLGTVKTSHILMPSSQNRINHIMQPKHRWDLVNVYTWQDASNIIEYKIRNGISGPYKAGNQIFSTVYMEQVVQAVIHYEGFVPSVVDAWVKMR